MATQGTYAAYAPLKGVGDQTSENLRHAERMGIYYRRDEAEKQQRKRDRLSDLAKQMGTDLSELTFNDSGIKSVDAPLYEYFSRAKGEVANLYQRLEENPDDFNARILLEKKMNSAKTLAGFTKRYAEWQQDYSQGIASGDYSKYLNKNLPQKINASLKQGRYKVLNDKNGDLQLFIDMDGDGEMDPDVATLNVQEFLSGNPLYVPKQAASVEQAVTSLSDNYGTADITDQDGFNTTRIKGFDPANEDKLYADINALTGSTVDTMTDEAKSMLADDLGIDPATITPQGFKEFKDRIADSVKSRIDRVYEEETDFGAMTAAGNLAERRKENAGVYDKEEETPPTNTIEVMTGEEGGTDYEKGTTSFSLPQAATLKTDKGVVDVLEIVMQGEELVFKGTQTKGSGTKATTSPVRITNDAQKNKLVRRIPNPETGKNFQNLEEVYSYLNKVKATQGLPDL